MGSGKDVQSCAALGTSRRQPLRETSVNVLADGAGKGVPAIHHVHVKPSPDDDGNENRTPEWQPRKAARQVEQQQVEHNKLVLETGLRPSHPALQGCWVTEKLGSGAFSRVFLARPRRPGGSGPQGPYVLKVVDLSSACKLREDYKSILRSEGSSLSRFNQPGFVACYGAWGSDPCTSGNSPSEHLVLALEHLSGGMLLDILKKGPLPERFAASAFLQVLTSIMFMHHNGFLHRDLKPDNIMLARAWTPESGSPPPIRLIDLGMVLNYVDQPHVTGLMGSPGYMSPEAIRGHRHTPAMDMYSLGVLLFVMLTGCKPLPSAVANKLSYHSIETCDYPGLRMPQFQRLSADAKDLVVSLMQRAPANRPSARKTLTHRWLQSAVAAWHADGVDIRYTAVSYPAMHEAVCRHPYVDQLVTDARKQCSPQPPRRSSLQPELRAFRAAPGPATLERPPGSQKEAVAGRPLCDDAVSMQLGASRPSSVRTDVRNRAQPLPFCRQQGSPMPRTHMLLPSVFDASQSSCQAGTSAQTTPHVPSNPTPAGPRLSVLCPTARLPPSGLAQQPATPQSGTSRCLSSAHSARLRGLAQALSAAAAVAPPPSPCAVVAAAVEAASPTSVGGACGRGELPRHALSDTIDNMLNLLHQQHANKGQLGGGGRAGTDAVREAKREPPSPTAICNAVNAIVSAAKLSQVAPPTSTDSRTYASAALPIPRQAPYDARIRALRRQSSDAMARSSPLCGSVQSGLTRTLEMAESLRRSRNARLSAQLPCDRSRVSLSAQMGQSDKL